MLLPSERPRSGSFRGPKMISASTRMIRSSGMPREGNPIVTPGKFPASDSSDYRTVWTGSWQGCTFLRYMRKYRSLSAAVFVVVLCALAGGFFGRRALAQDQLDQQYRVLADALQAIENTYVGETEADRLVYSAISGMLQTLDPHSSFMDPRAYKTMRERQEGRYYGLGISIGSIDGDLTISQVFEGSPAYEKGLRRGDVIARIESQDAKGWTTEQAVEKLRGDKGTTVTIGVRRAGFEKLIDLTVRRDEVRMPTVPAAVMLDATTDR